MKMPRFTQAFIDRHGNARFYFRRTGFKRAPLPGLPWSPEFMAAYEAAMAGQPHIDRRTDGQSRAVSRRWRLPISRRRPS